MKLPLGPDLGAKLGVYWREQKENNKAKETEAENAGRWAEAMACADLARPAIGPKVWVLGLAWSSWVQWLAALGRMGLVW